MGHLVSELDVPSKMLILLFGLKVNISTFLVINQLVRVFRLNFVGKAFPLFVLFSHLLIWELSFVCH